MRTSDWSSDVCSSDLAYIINDAAGVKKYGLVMVYPGAPNLKKLLQAGYVTEGTTLRALAHKIGVDPGGLERTVSRVNELAKTGKDADFGKGDTLRSEEHTSELQSLMRISYAVFCLKTKTAIDEKQTTCKQKHEHN